MADSQQNQTPAEVLASRAAFTAAVARRDAGAAADLYAADAMLLAPQMDWIEGRAAIAAFWAAGLETGIAGIEFDPLTVATSDSIAYELGRYAMSIQAEDGRALTDTGDYVLLHRRDGDGRWRRAVEVMTSAEAGVPR